MKFAIARASDKKMVIAFLRAMDPQDYTISRLDWLMANGQILLLFDGKKLVGMDRFERKPDGSAWFSAARIHPDYRGRRLINWMNDHALALPELRGASKARMLITTDNKASTRAAFKGGYRVAAKIALLEWEPKGLSERGSVADAGFLPASAREFELHAKLSPAFGAMNGLFYLPPEVIEMNEGALRHAQEHGWLFLSKLAGPLVARVTRHEDRDRLDMQPFAGTTQAARCVLDFARQRRADSVQIVLPDLEHLTSAYIAAGFTYSEWGRHARIFERAVKPGITSSEAQAAPARRRGSPARARGSRPRGTRRPSPPRRLRAQARASRSRR